MDYNVQSNVKKTVFPILKKLQIQMLIGTDLTVKPFL